MKPRLLFVHGWSFGPDFWDALALRLHDYPQARADLGYFSPPHFPRPDDDFVIVAHSFGAMRALQEYAGAPQLRAFVAVNGFARFSQAPDFSNGAPHRVLQRMLTKFETHPMEVLADFRRQAGAPHEALRNGNVAALARDLAALRDDDQRKALVQLSAPVMSLVCADDAIAPANGMRAARNVITSARAAGGHTTPLSAPSWCADEIRKFLNATGQA